MAGPTWGTPGASRTQPGPHLGTSHTGGGASSGGGEGGGGGGEGDGDGGEGDGGVGDGRGGNGWDCGGGDGGGDVRDGSPQYRKALRLLQLTEAPFSYRSSQLPASPLP